MPFWDSLTKGPHFTCQSSAQCNLARVLHVACLNPKCNFSNLNSRFEFLGHCESLDLMWSVEGPECVWSSPMVTIPPPSSLPASFLCQTPPAKASVEIYARLLRWYICSWLACVSFSLLSYETLKVPSCKLFFSP